VRTQATADAPTQTVRYAIGLNGERIARRAEGHTTYNLYAEQHLTMEADEAGRITRHYIYLDWRPIARIDIAPDGKPERYALHTDALGAVLAVTDEAAQLVWAARLEPFGTAQVTYARMRDGKTFEQDLPARPALRSSHAAIGQLFPHLRPSQRTLSGARSAGGLG